MSVRRRARLGACLAFALAQLGTTAHAAEPVVAGSAEDAEKAPAAVDPRRSPPKDEGEAARESAERRNAQRLQAHLGFVLKSEWSRYLRRGEERTFFGHLEQRYRRRRIAGGILLGLAAPTLVYGSVAITGASDPGLVLLGALCVGGGVVVSSVGIGLTISGTRRLRSLRAAGETLRISGARVRLRGVGPILHPRGGLIGFGAGIEF